MQLVTELGIVLEYRVLHDLGRQVGLSLGPFVITRKYAKFRSTST